MIPGNVICQYKKKNNNKNYKNSNNSDFLGVEKLCQNDQLMVLLLSDLFLCDENGIMNVIGVLSS